MNPRYTPMYPLAHLLFNTTDVMEENMYEPIKSLLYKGDESRYSPIGKHPGLAALAASIERGREVVEKSRKLIEMNKLVKS